MKQVQEPQNRVISLFRGFCTVNWIMTVQKPQNRVISLFRGFCTVMIQFTVVKSVKKL